MAEEVGSPGGKEYARLVREAGEKHVVALESDAGGFAPWGFEGSPRALDILRGLASQYLAMFHIDHLLPGEGGSDIAPLAELGVPVLGYLPVTTHYFDYHHSSLDRLENVKPDELNDGAAAMAIVSYLAAETGFELRSQ